MADFLLSGMFFPTQKSMMRNFVAFAFAIFCGFIQTKFSLGSASVFSQNYWSWKTVPLTIKNKPKIVMEEGGEGH